MTGRSGPFSSLVLRSELSATKSFPFLPASRRAASRKDACPGWTRSKTPFVRTNVAPLRASRLRISTALLSDTSLGFPGMESDGGTLEELLRLLEELSRRRFVRVPGHPRELLQHLALFRGERGRDLHVDPDKLVAVAPPAKGRHSAVAQPEGRSALRSRRDPQARLSRKRRHLDRTAEHGKCELDRDLAEKVVPLALEQLVFLQGEDDVEVARRPAGRSRLAVSRRPQARARVDPRRNPHA